MHPPAYNENNNNNNNKIIDDHKLVAFSGFDTLARPK